MQFNEQEDGSVIVVGFNITGGLIDVGNGSVMELTYQASTVLSETIVDLNMLEFYLGDISGSAIPAFSQNGQITITSRNPAKAPMLGILNTVAAKGWSMAGHAYPKAGQGYPWPAMAGFGGPWRSSPSGRWAVAYRQASACWPSPIMASQGRLGQFSGQ